MLKVCTAVVLTEVTGKTVIEIPIKLCPVSFLQPCAESEIRQLHMTLTRENRRELLLYKMDCVRYRQLPTAYFHPAYKKKKKSTK